MSHLYFLFFVLLSLSSYVSSQQLIDLKSFRGGNVKNPIEAKAPYDVFLSATSDDMDLLSQITLVTLDKQNITFYQLKHRKPFLTTSQIQPFPVQTSAYITTSLTDNQMKSLTGMIFISSTKQLQVNNFHVVDVDKAQNLNLPDGNQTILFLNSNMATSPFQSSTISYWVQPANSSIYIFKGIPTDEPEEDFSFIFSNPVDTADGPAVFVQNVEKFSLSLGAFYIKNYGELSFQINSEYYDADGSTTSDVTTTGFYMKTVNQKEKDVTINTTRDPAYSGITGNNIVGSIPNNGTVTFGVYDESFSMENTLSPRDQILGFSIKTIGQKIQISSNHSLAGEFYMQYYVNQGKRNGNYTTIETTTKDSTSWFSAMHFAIAFLIYLNLT